MFSKRPHNVTDVMTKHDLFPKIVFHELVVKKNYKDIFVVVKNTARHKQPMMNGPFCHDDKQHKHFFLPLLVKSTYTISSYELSRNVPSNSKYTEEKQNQEKPIVIYNTV